MGYKILAVVLVIALLFEIQRVGHLLSYKQFVVPKAFFAINAILFAHVIFGYIYRQIEQLPQNRGNSDGGIRDFSPKSTPEQIAFADIMTFVYANNGFPVQAAKEEFGLTVPQIKQIGDDLEEVGILTRGPNNARVLNEKIEKPVIDELLQKVNITIDKLTGTFIENGRNYDALPSLIRQSCG